jgi:hypothetical protein
VTDGPQWKVEECRSCNKPVIFALTDKGKHMPLDAYPSPDGTLKLFRDESGEVRCTVVKPAHLQYGRRDLRKSHFASCPEAKKWRKR